MESEIREEIKILVHCRILEEMKMRNKNIRKLFLTKEAVDLLKSTAFYFGSPNKVTGELRKSKTYWIRALFLVNIISKANYNKHFNFSKDKSFRDAAYENSTLTDLLKTLQSIGLVKIIPRKSNEASQYILQKKYIGECEVLLKKPEEKLFVELEQKQYNRGAKATTDKPISIIISKKYFEDEMISLDKSYETIETQWKIIEEINLTGCVSAKGKRNSRIYSKFTELSKVVHPFVRIENQQVCEYDQHATYFTLLPNAIKTIFLNLSTEQYQCISNLSNFIINSKNIYEEIYKETFIDISELKENVNSFICDPSKSMVGVKLQIRNWFKEKFPYCSDLIDMCRENKRLISKITQLERNIFISSANQLKRNGIDVLTKHDAIFFLSKDQNIVKATLDKKFTKANVCNKLKYTNYEDRFNEISAKASNKSIAPFVAHDLDKGSVLNLQTDTNGQTIIYQLSIKGGDRNTTVVDIPQFEPLKGTVLKGTKKTRNRATEIRTTLDGRWVVKIKSYPYYSVVEDKTLEQFKQRIEREFPNVIWKK